MSRGDLYTEFVGAQANLKVAQDKVAQFQIEIDRAADEERQWQEIAGRKRDLLASKCFINKRLPAETLSSIFMHLVEGFDTRYPWSLLAVCKLWNTVCLENPSLWSRFDLSSGHLCGDDAAQGDDASVVLRTMKQLERSRSADISIHAGTLCDCTIQVARFRTIVEHSSRWKAVEFAGIKSRNALGAEFLQKLIPQRCQFTKLQSIEWAALPADGNALKLPFTNYAFLPSLSSVTFSGVMVIKGDQQFPWIKLARLFLYSYHGPGRDLLPILSLCKNLKHLTVITQKRLSDAVDPHSANADTDMVTLPGVTFAAIIERNSNSRLLSNFTPFLRLPSLTSLTMLQNSALEDVLSLIQRSGCGESLTALTFSVATAPQQPTAFLPLLQACPNLEQFTYLNTDRNVSDTPSYDELLRFLVIHEGGAEVRCPRLKMLRFHGVKLDPVLVVQMVDSRIRVTNTGPISSSHLEMLDIGCPPAATIAGGSPSPEEDRDYTFFKSLLQQKYEKTNLQLFIT